MLRSPRKAAEEGDRDFALLRPCCVILSATTTPVAVGNVSSVGFLTSPTAAVLPALFSSSSKNAPL